MSSCRLGCGRIGDPDRRRGRLRPAGRDPYPQGVAQRQQAANEVGSIDVRRRPPRLHTSVADSIDGAAYCWPWRSQVVARAGVSRRPSAHTRRRNGSGLQPTDGCGRPGNGTASGDNSGGNQDHDVPVHYARSGAARHRRSTRATRRTASPPRSQMTTTATATKDLWPSVEGTRTC